MSKAKLTDDPWLAPFYDRIHARRLHAETLAEQLTQGTSLWDWAQGHRWFGLHRLEDGSWIYRDWAPNATALYLIGDFTDWQISSEFQASRVNDGCWELYVSADKIKHAQHYRIYIEWDGGCGERLPAWTQKTWQSAETLDFTAQVWECKEFPWKHKNPTPSSFVKIYEAHPGIATEEEKVGSWREFTNIVLPKIAASGYDTIQLMAVMEHPYYGSFGYHVGSFFAPSSRFGTPEDLKKLVDAAHGLGLRVIMDLVHSHAVKNEVEGISAYDGSPWQFFHGEDRGDHIAWDSRCFDYSKHNVLHFLCSNLRYWLEEFHFDGFRFDGVTSMLYHDHGLGKNFQSYDDYFDENIDTEALAYLRIANQLIHEGRPHAITIAEDVSGMPGLGADTSDDGIGFDYRLAMGLPDLWFKFAEEIRDEDWSMNWLWHELTNRRNDEQTISYVESHDQALVGGKSFLFNLIDAEMYHSMHKGSENHIVERGIALHKMARLATLAAAGHGYLNFMGNEFGHPEWIDFPREGNDWSYAKARRLWSLRDNEELQFSYLHAFDLNILTFTNSRYFQQDILFIKADDGDKVLAFKRGNLLFIFNFHPHQNFENYGFNIEEGNYELLLSSDEIRYGGKGRDKLGTIIPVTSGWLKISLPNRVAQVWMQKERR